MVETSSADMSAERGREEEGEEEEEEEGEEGEEEEGEEGGGGGRRCIKKIWAHAYSERKPS